jgi:hypothetical protein
MALGDYNREKLDKLEATYSIHGRHFTEGLNKVDKVQLRQRGFFSIHQFFMNPHVIKLLQTRKFSQKQYVKAIDALADEIGTCGQSEIDFTEIKPYMEMERQLAGYIRKNPTKGPKALLQKSVRALGRYHDKLRDVGVVPIIYGSIRYGDSTVSSDLDCRFLSTEKDPDVGRVVEDISCRISRRLHVNGIDDFHDDIIIDTLELQGTLVDIIDGEADEVKDYEFHNNIFFPYGVIVEGLVPEPFDTKEVNELRGVIHQAAEKDPFFELLLCYDFNNAILKRKSKIKT